MVDKLNKTLIVSDEVKKGLDNIKIHPRQSYNEIIQQLINERKE